MRLCHKIATQVNESTSEVQLELDSHADSPVLGHHARITRNTGRFVSVRGFTDELGAPIRVPVVDGAVKYECEFTGKSYALHIRNALHMPSMKNHLIPPIMMRLAGLIVNECPKFLSRNPSIEDHSIYFAETDIRLPLTLSGTTSYLPTSELSKGEAMDLDILELTPQVEVWDPHSNVYQDQEYSMTDYRGQIRRGQEKKSFVLSGTKSEVEMMEPRRIISSVINNTLDPTLLAEDLLSRAHCSNVEFNDEDNSWSISSVRTERDDFISVVKAKGAKSDLTAERLAKVFGISVGLAVKTLNTVTRLCPRNATDISLKRRYGNNDRMIRYNRMFTELFMDTMFAKQPDGKSARGYTCCQVFATEFGWVFPVLMQPLQVLTTLLHGEEFTPKCTRLHSALLLRIPIYGCTINPHYKPRA